MGFFVLAMSPFTADFLAALAFGGLRLRGEDWSLPEITVVSGKSFGPKASPHRLRAAHGRNLTLRAAHPPRPQRMTVHARNVT